MRSSTTVFFWSFQLFSGLFSLAVATPRLSHSVVHEKRDHIPAGWSHSRKHHATAVLPLRFALAQSNIHAMHEFVNDVAHPESPYYGKHWTAAQVAAKFSPSHDTIQTVRDWLSESGFAPERIHVKKTKSWIELNATVEEAERLLNAEYYLYKHASGKEHVACKSYDLPAHVAAHVDLVMPTVHFNTIVPRALEQPHFVNRYERAARGLGMSRVGSQGSLTAEAIPILKNQLEHCDEQITPKCLKALYGIDYTPVATEMNTIGIFAPTPQAYIASDIDKFAKFYAPDIHGKRPMLVSIDGGFVQTLQQNPNFTSESNLDIMYAMALVTGKQNVSLYQTGDVIESSGFGNFLDALDGAYCDGADDPVVDSIYPDEQPGGYKGRDCGTVKPANVISTSYGLNEADVSAAYAARQCAEYAKLALMGTTMLFSSGDSGVAAENDTCLDADGSLSVHGKRFSPSWPSTCPYVTSVGSTQVNPGSTVHQPESAANFTGGGFSNYLAMPEYQKNAVHGYLKNHPPPYSQHTFNRTGRAFPDVAVNGVNFTFFDQGRHGLIFGTSASAPTMAAIITLINDARLAAGKSTVGFINPSLYSPHFADAFNDITTGNNPGCGTRGFNATKGWDPVSGVGTPKFGTLLKKFLELP